MVGYSLKFETMVDVGNTNVGVISILMIVIRMDDRHFFSKVCRIEKQRAQEESLISNTEGPCRRKESRKRDWKVAT